MPSELAECFSDEKTTYLGWKKKTKEPNNKNATIGAVLKKTLVGLFDIEDYTTQLLPTGIVIK